MSEQRIAYDFTGVRIGTVNPDGVVCDDGGVRIGTVSSDGVVCNFGGVRIGTISLDDLRPRANRERIAATPARRTAVSAV
jgi:hypothetical protein